MYWPDYHIGPRRKSRWPLALFLGLLAGVVGAVLLNGHWLPEAPELDNGLPSSDVYANQSLPAPATPTQRPAVASVGDAATVPTIVVKRVETAGPVPDFSLPDLFAEQTVIRLAELRGRPVILNFWASWCVPCRREMPSLQATAARYEPDGLLLLGMNQTYIDDLGEARAFVEELGLTFPQTRDDTGATGAEAYGMVGIPTTVFIDRDGQVAHIQIGEMSLEQITAFTERLVGGKSYCPDRLIPPGGACLLFGFSVQIDGGTKKEPGCAQRPPRA